MTNDKLIIKKCCKERFEVVKTAITKLMDEDKETIIIGIDGKCASGKTTLGYYLKDIFKKVKCRSLGGFKIINYIIIFLDLFINLYVGSVCILIFIALFFLLVLFQLSLLNRLLYVQRNS